MIILIILAVVVIIILSALLYAPFVLSGRIAQWEEDHLGIRRS
jgi:uncharacterized protein HemY